MAAESQQKPRRVVVAPPAAILSVVVTLVFAGLGVRLIVAASSPVEMSIGIAALWIGVNVLIVGLVSSSAWRRRAIVVGGEKTESGTVAEARSGSGRRHGVVLRSPGAGGVRTLHGFATLSGPSAERLAGRLNGLFGAAIPAPEEPGPDSWIMQDVGPVIDEEPVVGTTTMAEVRSVAGDEAASGDDNHGVDDNETVLLRRALPLISAGVSVDGPPDDPDAGTGAPDDTVVLPRRGRTE